MPTQAGDYDQKSPALSGMVVPYREPVKRMMLGSRFSNRHEDQDDAAKTFAARVEQRSKDYSGGGRYGRVWIAMVIQAMFVTVTLLAFYYGEVGGVVIWLSTVSFCRLRLMIAGVSDMTRSGAGCTYGIFSSL